MQKSPTSLLRVLVSSFLALVLTSHRLPGQTPGSPDPSFETGSTVNLRVRAVAMAAEGKFYIGGEFAIVRGMVCNRIARLNPDGSADESFDPGLGANNTVNSIVVQGDGKLLIAGQFTSYNGTARNQIARLNSDGSLDATFEIGSGVSGVNVSIHTIAAQKDGKVLIGGLFTNYNGTARSCIARLNSDGSLDTTFNPGSGVGSTVHTIALQDDGKVLIGGGFNTYNGTARGNIARLNSNGSLDTTFDPGWGPTNYVSSITVQGDGKFLIGGGFLTVGAAQRNGIARLNSDGSLDTTFDPGSGVIGSVYSIKLQGDGKVLIGGGITGYNGSPIHDIARLNSNGSLDSTFDSGLGGDGAVPYEVSSIAMQGDGRAIIGGWFRSYSGTMRSNLARINSDGSLDPTLDPGSGANSHVYCLTLQENGKVLIGGSFTRYNGVTRNRVARLLSNGSLDLTFDPGLGLDSYPEAVAAQWDGKVLIGGGFTHYNAIDRSCIARINSDGSLDTTFDPGSGADNRVYALSLQRDGKVLIGGAFINYNGTESRRLARLSSDGSLDTTFNIGSGPNTEVHSIVAQGDGKVLIAGGFISYNGTTRKCIARLNSDGSLDATFDPGSGANDSIKALAVQGDGKILIAGEFTSYNDTTRMHVARLHSDGSLDTTFDLGTGANGDVHSLTLQGDGKVLIAGFFGTYKGIARNCIARLNSDGSLDSTFNPGSGANYGEVEAMALQDDGKALIGGRFAIYNGAASSYLARLSTGPTTRKLGTFDLGQVLWFRGESVPDLSDVTFDLSTDGGASWSPLGDGIRVGTSANWQLSGLSLPNTGLLRARGSATSGSSMIEQVVPIKVVTEAPTLIAPANSTVTTSPVSVSFTLPEAALPGSVTLSFGVHVLTLDASQAGVGSHSFTFNPANPTASPEIASGEPIPDGSYTVTLSYQDTLEHPAATASVIGVILDTTPPTATVPEDITLIATSATGAMVTYASATATDAVTANPSVTYSKNSGTIFPLGTTVVTVTATDGVGNVGTKTFRVTVQPSADANLASLGAEGVVLEPAFDPTTTAYRATVGYLATTATLTALPAFPSATIAQTPANPATLAVGENEIKVVVTAQNGSTKIYTVTIKRTMPDNTKPAVKITAPGARVVDDSFTASGIVKEFIGLTRLTVSLNESIPIPVSLATDTGDAIPWSLAGLVPENGTNTLVVTATDYNGNIGIATKTFAYTNPAFAEMAGVYSAILVPTEPPSATNIGLVTVTVTKTGTFTAKAKLPGIAKGAKGILHNDGTAHFQIQRTLADSMPLGLAGNMSFSVKQTDGLTGSVDTATFVGKIAPFSKNNLVPAIPFLNQPVDPTRPPTKGLYNIVIQPTGTAAGTPSGCGYASVTISNTGAVKLNGRLADGTKLSAATRLRADATVPVFALLYDNKGGFGTDLRFATQDDTDVLGENPVWVRPVGKPTDRAFPAGWPAGLEIDILGTHWNGAASLNVGQGDSNPSVGNAVLTFDAGALPSSLNHAIDLHPATGKVTAVPAVGADYKLSVNPTTGIFNGTFTHADGTKPKFGGILINKGINQAGFGYFLSTPVTGAPSQGGRVVLDPLAPKGISLTMSGQRSADGRTGPAYATLFVVWLFAGSTARIFCTAASAVRPCFLRSTSTLPCSTN